MYVFVEKQPRQKGPLNFTKAHKAKSRPSLEVDSALSIKGIRSNSTGQSNLGQKYAYSSQLGIRHDFSKVRIKPDSISDSSTRMENAGVMGLCQAPRLNNMRTEISALTPTPNPTLQLRRFEDDYSVSSGTPSSKLSSTTRQPRKTKKEIEKEKKEAKRLRRCDLMASLNTDYCFRMFGKKKDNLEKCLDDVEYNHEKCNKELGSSFVWGLPECEKLPKEIKKKCIENKL